MNNDINRYLFREYLLWTRNSTDDGRHRILVDDPSQANAFIIDHRWEQVKKKNPAEVHGYLVPIIDNVVNNYPYYNRSHGMNHFMMAVYDHGFCFRFHGDFPRKGGCLWDGCNPITPYLQRISNVSFIGK